MQLHPRQRAKTVDVLAANLSMLCSSAQGLLSSQEAVQADAVLLHKNGLRMLVHLLHVIAMQADKDAQQAQGAENAAKPKAAGTRWGRCRHSCKIAGSHMHFLEAVAACTLPCWCLLVCMLAAAVSSRNACTCVTAGRGRKAAGADDDSWDWQHSRQRMLLAVRELLLLDLKALFRGLAAAEQLINLAMELVSVISITRGRCCHAAAMSAQLQE